jgi:hypothetical protein
LYSYSEGICFLEEQTCSLSFQEKKEEEEEEKVTDFAAAMYCVVKDT